MLIFPAVLESTIFIGKAFFDKGVAGTEHTIEINGNKGVLAFPCYPLGYVSSSNLERTFLSPPANTTVSFDEKRTEWGETSSRFGEDGIVISDLRVFFKISSEHSDWKLCADKKTKDINKLYYQWLTDFQNSLEVYSWQDLKHPSPGKVLDRYLTFNCWINDNLAHSTMPTVGFVLPGSYEYAIAINLEIVTASIENANNGLRPPIEYLLLRDAHRELFHGSTRRAVLDAATAAEMSLTNAAKAELVSSLSEGIASKILRKYDGLIKKEELCRTLNIALPYTKHVIDNGLNKFRNNVIHRGHTPTFQEAKEAIDISIKVVKTLLPLTFKSRDAD